MEPKKIPTTIKLSKPTRRIIEEAAAKRGVTLSEFIRDAAFELAVRTVETCRNCGQPHPAKVA
jgi:uncharacterized protein (DUF1778 family)